MFCNWKIKNVVNIDKILIILVEFSWFIKDKK